MLRTHANWAVTAAMRPQDVDVSCSSFAAACTGSRTAMMQAIVHSRQTSLSTPVAQPDQQQQPGAAKTYCDPRRAVDQPFMPFKLLPAVLSMR